MSSQEYWGTGEASQEFVRLPHFQGCVALTPRVEVTGQLTILDVVFQAGSHTDWHIHEGGQLLVSVSGAGWVQESGGNQEPLAPGQNVWCPPGVLHRHGAVEDEPWHQLSVTHGATTWCKAGQAQQFNDEITEGNNEHT